MAAPGPLGKGDLRNHEGVSQGGRAPCTTWVNPAQEGPSQGLLQGLLPGGWEGLFRGVPELRPNPSLGGPDGETRMAPWTRRGARNVTGETPGHLAGSGSRQSETTYQVASRGRKGREGAGENKFKRGPGCQHPRQPTKKLPKRRSPPIIRPRLAPARPAARGGPRVPPAAGLGKVGRATAQVPQPGPPSLRTR